MYNLGADKHILKLEMMPRLPSEF